MTNAKMASKFTSAAALANLARGYRSMAQILTAGPNRERLLRMADETEERSRRGDGSQSKEPA